MAAATTITAPEPTLAGWVASALRQRRYEQRSVLWSLSHLERVRRCGYKPTGGEGVEVRQAGGIAHYSNLQTCGSIHACPVCAPKIRAERATEIDDLLAAHYAAGGGAEFWTETMPHDFGDQLAPLLDAINGAHRKTLTGGTWLGRIDYAHAAGCTGKHTPAGCPGRIAINVRTLGLRASLGVVGTVTALEVTYGANGWHPHLHTILLTEKPWTDDQRARFLDHAAGTWERAIVAAGYRRPGFDRRGRRLDDVAVTVTPVDQANRAEVAAYLAKHVEGFAALDERARAKVVRRNSRARAEGWSVAAEVARGDLKAGKAGGLTPFQLLAAATEDGDADALSRWWEWEEASKGRQAIRWSFGLRKRYDLGDERTDEEIAAAEVGGEVVMVLDLRTWAILRRHRGGSARLLTAIERGGRRGGERFLVDLLGLVDHRDTGS